MSATYIAGYRIGMLMAGTGALFLATYFGSIKGEYNYQAWQMTYLLMAALMLIGMLTTLIIKEPESNVTYSAQSNQHYLGFFLLFVLAVVGFVSSFYFTSAIAVSAKSALIDVITNTYLAAALVGLARLAFALTMAAGVAKVVVMSGLVQGKQVLDTYVEPIHDFFQRYGWSLAWLLLALIGLYRISDIVMGVVANVFYYDMGFSKNEIGAVVKTFGLVMTILGSFIGGLLVVRFGVMRVLFLGAVLSAVTNLLFMLLAQSGPDITMLYIVISADNLSGGLAVVAFIAFLSSLTNISFTAVQYAIFSSVMTLLPKILGGYSGTMVETMGYQQFFLLTALMGIPVLLLIVWANKRFDIDQKD